MHLLQCCIFERPKTVFVGVHLAKKFNITLRFYLSFSIVIYPIQSRVNQQLHTFRSNFIRLKPCNQTVTCVNRVLNSSTFAFEAKGASISLYNVEVIELYRCFRNDWNIIRYGRVLQLIRTIQVRLPMFLETICFPLL